MKSKVFAVDQHGATSLAGAAAALLALGMFGLVSAILAGTPPLARLAAASVAAGALITAGQMLGISRRRPA